MPQYGLEFDPKEDLEKFRRNGTGTSIPDCLSAEEFISLAREYLLERKSYEMLAFYSFEIIQLELDDYRNPEWKPFYYFQVTFKTFQGIIQFAFL